MLFIRTLLHTLIFLMLFTASAHSDPCVKAMTQTGMNSCAGAQFKQADNELNATYLKLKERYADDQGAVAGLTKAQRAWVAFRDAECELEAYPTQGGSVQSMIRLNCLARLTESRTPQLRERLNCEEGDLSCILARSAE